MEIWIAIGVAVALAIVLAAVIARRGGSMPDGDQTGKSFAAAQAANALRSRGGQGGGSSP